MRRGVRWAAGPLGRATAAGAARADVTRVRRPAAAGTFYPSDPEELAATVDRLLAQASPPTDVRDPVALIVPHAGHTYSGPIAATGFRTLRGSDARRVVLLGPSHFVPLTGMAVPLADAWRTPLGDVTIEDELRDVAVGHGAAVDDLPHAREHALEVQLPFLLRALRREPRALPVAVGSGEVAVVAELIDAIVRGRPDVRVIVSSDLSHYHDAETARELDRRTVDAIVAMDGSAIGPGDACGVHALRGAVEWARRRHLAARILDVRNSADTAGDARRVVGYASIALGARDRGADE